MGIITIYIFGCQDANAYCIVPKSFSRYTHCLIVGRKNKVIESSFFYILLAFNYKEIRNKYYGV